jgi:hypothetical protein
MKKYEPMGICDRTGFLMPLKDLVKQMVWKGNRLVWTNRLVGKDEVDPPSEKEKTSPRYRDPKPLKDPRPPQPTSDQFVAVDISDVPYSVRAQKLTSIHWNKPPVVKSDSNEPDGIPVTDQQSVRDKLNKIHWRD